MKRKDLFQKDKYYLIYNHGNSDEHIFKREENYFYFLKKHDEYMNESWQLISWCLLPDCYYMIVRISNDFSEDASWELINKLIYTAFGNFTNAYAKAINKSFTRRGSLFAKNFKRRLICDDEELRRRIIWIHHQPLHRKFVHSSFDWRFSSCQKGELYQQTIQFKEMMRVFGSVENFIHDHEKFFIENIAA